MGVAEAIQDAVAQSSPPSHIANGEVKTAQACPIVFCFFTIFTIFSGNRRMPVSEFDALVCVVALSSARASYLLCDVLGFWRWVTVTIAIFLVLLAALPPVFSRPRAVTHALLSVTLLTILLFCISPSSRILPQQQQPGSPVPDFQLPAPDAPILFRPEWWEGEWSVWEDDPAVAKPRHVRRRQILCWNFTDVVEDALCEVEQLERAGRKRPDVFDFRESRCGAPTSGS